MRWWFAPAGLSIVVLISLACAGQGPEKSGLAKELPDIVQVNDVASGLGLPEYAVRIVEARYWSNEQMADQLPGDPFRISSDLQEIQAAGRVQGYLMRYAVGSTGAVTIRVNVALDLYADDAAAQRALETRPLNISRDAIIAPRVGDASIAWQQATRGDSPTCPCHFRFRVGPLLATVSTSYPGPARPPELDPAKVAVAEVMAERMREALDRG